MLIFDWASSLSCLYLIKELNTICDGLFFQMNCRIIFSLEKCGLAWLLQKIEAKTEDLSTLVSATPRDTVTDKGMVQERRGNPCKKVSRSSLLLCATDCSSQYCSTLLPSGKLYLKPVNPGAGRDEILHPSPHISLAKILPHCTGSLFHLLQAWT